MAAVDGTPLTSDPLPAEIDVLAAGEAGSRLLRGSVWRFGSYVGVVGLSIISAGLLLRHLGVNRFGDYTTVISLVSVVSSVTDAGMSSLGTREYAVRVGADRDELMRDLLGLRVLLTVIGMLVATGFAIAAGYDTALLLGTVAAGLGVVALIYQHTLSIPLTTALRLGALSAMDLARQVLSVALIVVLVILGAGVLPVLAVSLAVNLMLIFPTTRLTHGQISSRMAIRPHSWSLLLRATVSFSAASAVGTIYIFTAQILTSLVASKYQNGQFAASFRIFIVLSGVPGLLVGSALPVLARAARDDRQRLSHALQRMFEMGMLVGVAAALGCLSGATLMIHVVGGDAYAPAAGVLRIQGLALIATFVLAGWGFALLSLNRLRGLLIANGSALIVSTVLTLVLASADGARGSAIATVCGEFVLALGYLIVLVRDDRAYVPQLTVAVKVAVAAAPAAVLALAAHLPSLLSPILVLTVYVLLILLLRAVPAEVIELLPPRLRSWRGAPPAGPDGEHRAP